MCIISKICTVIQNIARVLVPYKLAVKKKTFFFDCTVNHKIIIALTILRARIIFYVMLLTLSEGNYYFLLLLLVTTTTT